MGDIRAAASNGDAVDRTIDSAGFSVPKDAPRTAFPLVNHTAFVLGYVQLQTGALTTGMTPAVERIGGGLSVPVGEANTEALKVAAGGVESFLAVATDEVVARSKVRYAAGYTSPGANSTTRQQSVLVLVF